MTDRIKREFALIAIAFGEVKEDSNFQWFIIERWPLPRGWNKEYTRVLIMIPPGYALTPPDTFCVDADLALTGGAQPGNASVVQAMGEQWLQFSYHIEASDWQPDKGHNLLTFLVGVTKRLNEVN